MPLCLSALQVGILLSANRWVRLPTNELAPWLGGSFDKFGFRKASIFYLANSLLSTARSRSNVS